MTVEADLAEALRAADAGPLVQEVFSQAGPDALAPFDVAATAIVGTASAFGRPTAIGLVRASSGIVVAFEIADAPWIVLKVHRDHTGDRLNGVLRAQRALRTAGLPVAEPLLAAPVPVGAGWGLVESWLANGTTEDVRPPDLRRAVAKTLHDISEALDAVAFGDLRPPWTGPYPPPHSPVFDFAATAPGAEWIDDHNATSLATKNRLMAEGVGREVVAHSDLRPENILVSLDAEPRVSTIYDLDSLIVGAEPWLVGGVARAFSTNWSKADPMIPEIDEIMGFISDYESSRPVPFTADERALADAGVQHALAYSARCEHALFPDGSMAPWGPGWRSLLRSWTEKT